jgi:hypothetical protein
MDGLRVQKLLVFEAPLNLKSIWTFVRAKPARHEILLAARGATDGAECNAMIASVSVNLITVGRRVAEVPEGVDSEHAKKKAKQQDEDRNADDL